MNIRNVEVAFQRMVVQVVALLMARGAKLVHVFDGRRDKISTVAGSQAVLSSEQVQELELLSESLHVDKEKVLEGEVTIRKEVITEIQVLHVPVTREELVVERRSPDGRGVVEIVRGQKELRIPISRERVIVKKEPVVSEIVRVGRRSIGETKRVSTAIKHEELRVIREGDANISGDEQNAA